MRQLELYRTDPKVGLVLPPSPLWVRIREDGPYVLAGGLAAYSIVRTYWSVGVQPITGKQAVVLALDSGMLFFAFVMYLVRGIYRRMSRDAEHMELVYSVLRDLQSVVKDVVERLPDAPGNADTSQ
jgi:hypothetical protein